MFSAKKIFMTGKNNPPSPPPTPTPTPPPTDPGKIWYTRTGGANEPISFANGHFYSAARRSTDGKSWQSLNAPQWRFLTGTDAFYGEVVSYQNGVYRIWDAYSYDGLNWIYDRPFEGPFRGGLDRYACHLVQGKFYATGRTYDGLLGTQPDRDLMYSSTSGIEVWTQSVRDPGPNGSPISFGGREQNAADTAIGPTKLIIITSGDYSSITIFTPATLELQGINLSQAGIENPIMGICHSPELNIFLILTASNAYTSTDGNAWAQRPLPIAGQWSRPAWNGTRFAAVHKTANIKLGIWSDDGINWNTTADFRGAKPEITYLFGGNGNFVSGGSTYLTSQG